MIIRLLPCLLLLLLLLSVTAPSYAETRLLVGCSLSVPPYVIRQNDRGITLDLMRRSLANAGLGMQMHYDSNAANIDSFNQGKLDALCITNATATPSAYFSTLPLMSFHNVAISLESSKAELKRMADLSNYRVQGFSMASRLLPVEFAAAVQQSPAYVEQADQMEQVRALFLGETDVVVMEQTIFRYFLSQLRRADPDNRAYHATYRYAELFEPTEYHAAFRSEHLRNRFDLGFRELQESGELQKIILSYEKLLADYLFH